MKIVLYGATGHAGSRILAELLRRGHDVVAVARNLSKGTAELPQDPRLTLVHGDLSSRDKIAEAIGSAEAVVSAYGPPADKTEELIDVTKREIAAGAAGEPASELRSCATAGCGGWRGKSRGSARGDAGERPRLPCSPGNRSHWPMRRRWNSFSSLQSTGRTSSPSAFFEPGPRTGKFRLAQDELLTAPDGKSSISMEDYAIALVDELEQPQHRRQRFTVGY